MSRKPPSPPTPPLDGRRAEVGLDRIATEAIEEDDREHRERVPLEGLHQVVPEERESRSATSTMTSRPSSGPKPNSVERERAADAVGGEPAEPAVTDMSTAGRALPLKPNASAAEHHLRHAVQRPARGQDVVRDRAEPGADHDAGDGLPEASSRSASTASTPTKIVANSRFGEVHVQNSWRGRPCRSASAMNRCRRARPRRCGRGRCPRWWARPLSCDTLTCAGLPRNRNRLFWTAAGLSRTRAPRSGCA